MRSERKSTYREREKAQIPIKIVKSQVEIFREYNTRKKPLQVILIDHKQQSASRLNM